MIVLAIFLGFLVGVVIGLATRSQLLGCAALLVVPFAMIAYVAWWQAANPGALRSTSALEFIFAPLWPSLGALVGYFAARLAQSHPGSGRD
ncbi:hypothetical protein [Erythrobacter sp. EC-HK427]|uniref:hypothetical protein n=1 Tax=Erythrobacter sp. EC-HK427 TaxID=2038396 RepID=UPI001258DF2C|nr:hypothetical protein [Erythrobacter sp. EC-HK427]VVT05502.1 conserved membrane hypothetical protein [Erythrobacter sp. EC-HK427]